MAGRVAVLAVRVPRMTLEITVRTAVEKVLFRLALIEGGRVAILRAFIELPLSVEDLEGHADAAVDGRVILRDDWGEFLFYDLPELKSQPGIAPPSLDDCPTCGRERPPVAPPEPAPGGSSEPATAPAPPRPVVCDDCFAAIRRAARVRDASVLARVKSFWRPEDPPEKVAQVEHEIFHVALGLGSSGITHTAIVARTRLPAALVKECLDRALSRRYVARDVLPSGDALAYRFPPDLAYPAPLYRRFKGHERTGLEGTHEGRSRDRAIEVKAKPTTDLKIVVKDRRQRPGRRPPGS